MKSSPRLNETPFTFLTRRQLLRSASSATALWAFQHFLPAYAKADVNTAALQSQPRGDPDLPDAEGAEAIELTIDNLPFKVDGQLGNAVAVNGSVPGPLLRLREGQEAVIHVNNRLDQLASIHWHGLLVPAEMDGVPGVSYAGIQPKSLFTYRFPLRQSGTYWAHAHDPSELIGLYFPLIIDPLEPEPFQYERDYVVMLSDWSFESPVAIISKLKKLASYYNFQKRTAADFFRDMGNNGFWSTLSDYLEWSKMRMDPTDFADVTGFTYHYLLNGLSPDANWTGLFKAGERIRLRFIDAGAMTYFDVRIPGLKMSVVQADGQNVKPVEVEEFRIAPGETLDVVVQPEDRAYTLFAETLDRSGYARGTLATSEGMSAPLPQRRQRPLRTMKDMGMDMSGMKGMEETEYTNGMHQHAHAEMSELKGPSLPGSPPVAHGPNSHGPGNSMVPMMVSNRLDEPGSGFENAAGKVLTYTDLESIKPQSEQREPEREIELHLTGNMERYMWSFDGKTYAEAMTPIPFHYGERLRLILVNDTMMEHPIHLHGMFVELENGRGKLQPLKHTISVKPAERLSMAITADEPGQWAFHCHLLLHMEMGMFRVVEVSSKPEVKS